VKRDRYRNPWKDADCEGTRQRGTRGPETSTEQRLVGGRALGKGLRACTWREATPRGQRGCSDASPPVDGEGSSKGARAAGKALRAMPSVSTGKGCFGILEVAPPGLVRQAVGVESDGNAANPGWHGLQNTRSRHAEQTVEVVRNHEGGTSGKRGSELPKGRLLQTGGWRASVIRTGRHRGWTRDGDVGGRARENESQERRTR